VIRHSIAEAKTQLSRLIDRALQGEEVVITRHGNPVVVLRPVQSSPQTASAADLDWLAERRRRRPPASMDGGTLVSEMRDEDVTA
jgi:prevent-host-death family protein